jgi:hypothetical protein
VINQIADLLDGEKKAIEGPLQTGAATPSLGASFPLREEDVFIA